MKTAAALCAGLFVCVTFAFSSPAARSEPTTSPQTTSPRTTSPGNRAALFAPDALVPRGAERNLACKAGERYSDLISNRHYDRIGSIFARDSVYYGPNDDPIRGPEKIGTFYRIFLGNAKPRTRIASLIPAGPHDCVMELIGISAGYVQVTPGAIDRFTTDDAGKVTRLYIYFRPKAAQALGPAAAPALAR